MPKILLEVIGEGPYIKAPDFCPYKQLRMVPAGLTMTGAEIGLEMLKDVVHPSLCPLCKICTFVPDIVPLIEPTQSEQEVFAVYLTTKNESLSSNIYRQRQYLMREDRIPIAILLSFQVFEDTLKATVEDSGRVKSLITYYLLHDLALCYILGCPVYISRKLTKSPIQVVGEIEWK